jgi:predicted lysophospholipase L1 biosynthesis ABC-type transport system permease subunit
MADAAVLSGARYGAGAADPFAWAGAALLLAVAAAASLVPARRAMHVDPVEVMRTEQVRPNPRSNHVEWAGSKEP